MATTIPAGTLRLLLALIGYRAKARKKLRREPPMVPRRPPRPCRWTAPPGGGCQADQVHPDRWHSARSQDAGRGKYRDRRRDDHVQVETLTHQQVRRVCTADSVSALAIDQQTAGADPARMVWSSAALTCTVSGVALVSGIGVCRTGAVIRSSVAQTVQHRQMRQQHNGGKTRQMAGNAPVKLCALFCGAGGITALT